MKSGICPKCQSREIYSGRKIKNKSGNHFNNTIPVTVWSHATLDNYVCGRCGYMESYLAKTKELEKIKQKWPQVEKGVEQME